MNLNTTKTRPNRNKQHDYASNYAALQQLVHSFVILRRCRIWFK